MHPQVAPWVGLARAVSARMADHRVSLAAGGLAFFVSLSVAPAALVIGWIAGLVLDPGQVTAVLSQITVRAPDVADDLKPVLDSITTLVEQASSATFTITSVVGLLLAVYSSSRVVYGLRLALNTAFDVPDRYRGFAERVASTVITLVGLVVVVAVIVLLTVIPHVLAAIGIEDVPVLTDVAVVDWGVVLLIVWGACWLLLRRGANGGAPLPIWAPSPILAAMWILAVSAGVGLYAQVSRTLGAAAAVFGSTIVIVMWIYLCFVGLLMAAEFEGARRRMSP